MFNASERRRFMQLQLLFSSLIVSSLCQIANKCWKYYLIEVRQQQNYEQYKAKCKEDFMRNGGYLAWVVGRQSVKNVQNVIQNTFAAQKQDENNEKISLLVDLIRRGNDRFGWGSHGPMLPNSYALSWEFGGAPESSSGKDCAVLVWSKGELKIRAINCEENFAIWGVICQEAVECKNYLGQKSNFPTLGERTNPRFSTVVSPKYKSNTTEKFLGSISLLNNDLKPFFVLMSIIGLITLGGYIFRSRDIEKRIRRFSLRNRHLYKEDLDLFDDNLDSSSALQDSFNKLELEV